MPAGDFAANPGGDKAATKNRRAPAGRRKPGLPCNRKRLRRVLTLE